MTKQNDMLKYDYAAALYEINKAGNQKEGGGVEFAIICAFDAAELIANHYDAIRHALAMMQRLSKPSHELIQAGVSHAVSNGLDGEPWPVYIQNILSAMLEQAELEIKQPKGELK